MTSVYQKEGFFNDTEGCINAISMLTKQSLEKQSLERQISTGF